MIQKLMTHIKQLTLLLLTISTYATAACGDSTTICGIIHCEFQDDSSSYKSTTTFNENTTIVSGSLSNDTYIVIEDSPAESNCKEFSEETNNFKNSTECKNGREIHTRTTTLNVKEEFEQDKLDVKTNCQKMNGQFVEEKIDN